MSDVLAPQSSRPWYQRVSWINLFYLVGTPVGAIYFTARYISEDGWSWGPFWFAAIFGPLTSLAITGGYHRLFAHRSYEARTWVRALYLLIGAGAFQGSALKWASDHRRHHRHVDTPDDPYNINQGFFWAHMGWLIAEDNPKYSGHFEKDLLADRLVAFQHKYYFVIASLVAFGFPMAVGAMMGTALGGLAMGGFVRLVLTNHSTFLINSLCHMVGSQPYTDKNSARDSFLMAVLAVGEGYHNYHHKFQNDYRNGVRWYHFDPTKWTIATLAAIGSAWSLRRTPAPVILQARMEMDEKRLLSVGVPAERLVIFRKKVEEAQTRLRQVREDYAVMKRNVQERSRLRLQHMKWEMKVARAEFRFALKQWRFHYRRPQPIGAF